MKFKDDHGWEALKRPRTVLIHEIRIMEHYGYVNGDSFICFASP
jgi:hypothetical protein